MMKLDQNPVSVVVSYSSLESAFIVPLVREAAKFSSDIIVVAYSHLFDGTPEDDRKLAEVALNFAGVRILVLPWEPGRPAQYWHNHARLAGAETARGQWVLFADADELPEGDAMREWLMNDLVGRSSGYDAYSFACYWYFREPVHRATQEFECAVMLRRTACVPQLLYSADERWEFRKRADMRALEHVLGPGGRPMWHHYSWVRPPEVLLRKVRSWAHRGERDWERLVASEFTHPFSGTDFVHGFQYQMVKNQFGIEV